MTSGSVVKSYFWSFMEQGSAKLLVLVVQIVLARLLDPAAFGVLAILLVVISLADSVAQSGLGTALIQKHDADELSFTTGWWLSLALSCVMYAVIFICAPFISVFYSMSELTNCLRVLGLMVFFNAANSIQRSYLQKKMDFKNIFRVSLAAVCVSGITGIVLACCGFGVWALVVQSLVQSVCTCVVLFIVTPWKPTLRFKQADAKNLISYGWKICITGILNVLNNGISELILGRVCTPEALGYYSNGRKYPNAIIIATTNAIANVMFPDFSRLKSNMDAFRNSMKQSLRLGSFVLVPLSAFCAVAAMPLVVILLGEKWLPCVFVFQLVSLGNITTMMMLVNQRAYMALGDATRYMRINLIKVFCGSGAVWITAAISHDIYITAFVNFAVNILEVLLLDAISAKRVTGYGEAQQLKDQLPVFLLTGAATAVSVVVGFFLIEPAAQFVVEFAVFCFVYFGGAKLFHFQQLDLVMTKMSKVTLRRK